MGRIAIEADLEFADLASSPEVEWDFEAADARARATDLPCRLKGNASRAEMDWVLGRAGAVEPEPGLERAARGQ